jgi:hypothetical protein
MAGGAVDQVSCFCGVVLAAGRRGAAVRDAVREGEEVRDEVRVPYPLANRFVEECSRL